MNLDDPLRVEIDKAIERHKVHEMVRGLQDELVFERAKTKRFAEALQRSIDGLELAYKATKMQALESLVRDALQALEREATDES